MDGPDATVFIIRPGQYFLSVTGAQGGVQVGTVNLSRRAIFWFNSDDRNAEQVRGESIPTLDEATREWITPRGKLVQQLAQTAATVCNSSSPSAN